MIMLRCASDSDLKSTLSKAKEWLKEAEKEGNTQRIATITETIQNIKTLQQIYNN